MAKQVQTDTFGGKLKECSYGEQYQRQRISDEWRPVGYERWQYMAALQNQMPILGGTNDHFGASPGRYREVTSCQDTLDCHCGE